MLRKRPASLHLGVRRSCSVVRRAFNVCTPTKALARCCNFQMYRLLPLFNRTLLGHLVIALGGTVTLCIWVRERRPPPFKLVWMRLPTKVMLISTAEDMHETRPIFSRGIGQMPRRSIHHFSVFEELDLPIRPLERGNGLSIPRKLEANDCGRERSSQCPVCDERVTSFWPLTVGIGDGAVDIRMIHAPLSDAFLYTAAPYLANIRK